MVEFRKKIAPGVSAFANVPNQINVGPLQIKIKEARDKGVPEADISRVLKNNAMKARDAKTRGALLQGGLGAIGQSRDNLSRGLAGAERGTAAPTYTSGLSNIGAGVAARGEAEAEYQGELSNIAKDKQVRDDRLAKETADRELREKEIADRKSKAEAKELKDREDLKKAQEAQVRYAKNAILELNKGAGKILNFASSAEVRKTVRFTGLAAIRLSNAQQSIHEWTEETMPEVINEYWQGRDQAALGSYTRLKTDVYNLYVEGRKRLAGQGQITEKESALIYETVVSLSNNANSLATALQYLINKILLN